MEIDGSSYLISDIRMGNLNWRMLVLIPLQARQAKITRTFIVNGLVVGCMVLVLFCINFFIVRHFRNRVEHSIEHDPLTALNNRKGIQRGFEKLVVARKPLAVILLDIDLFKKINDTYGHNAGDAVIKKISEILQNEVRGQDVLGRWGGEEFIILAPCEKPDTAQLIAERARLRIANTAFAIDNKQIHVTCSFGYTYAANPKQLTLLVAYADRALYQAKANGRNRTEYEAVI